MVIGTEASSLDTPCFRVCWASAESVAARMLLRKLLLAAAMALLLESSNALAVLVLQVWFL